MPLDAAQAFLETIDARCLTGNLQLQMSREIEGEAGNRLGLPCGYLDVRDIRAQRLLTVP